MLCSELIEKINNLKPIDQEDQRIKLLKLFIKDKPESYDVKMLAFSEFVSNYEDGIHSQTITKSLKETSPIGRIFRELLGMVFSDIFQPHPKPSTPATETKAKPPILTSPAVETKTKPAEPVHVATETETKQAGDTKTQPGDTKEPVMSTQNLLKLLDEPIETDPIDRFIKPPIKPTTETRAITREALASWIKIIKPSDAEIKDYTKFEDKKGDLVQALFEDALKSDIYKTKDKAKEETTRYFVNQLKSFYEFTKIKGELTFSDYLDVLFRLDAAIKIDRNVVDNFIKDKVAGYVKHHMNNENYHGQRAVSTWWHGSKSGARAEATADARALGAIALSSWIKIIDRNTKKDGSQIKDNAVLEDKEGELVQQLFEDVFKDNIYTTKNGTAIGYSAETIKKLIKIHGLHKGLTISDFLDFVIGLDVAKKFDEEREPHPDKVVELAYDTLFNSSAAVRKHVVLLSGRIFHKKDAFEELIKNGFKSVVYLDTGGGRHLTGETIRILHPNLKILICPNMKCPDETFNLIGKSSIENEVAFFDYPLQLEYKAGEEFATLDELLAHQSPYERTNWRTGEKTFVGVSNMIDTLLQELAIHPSRSDISIEKRCVWASRARYVQPVKEDDTKDYVYISNAPLGNKQSEKKFEEKLKKARFATVLENIMNAVRERSSNEYNFIVAQRDKKPSNTQIYQKLRKIADANPVVASELEPLENTFGIPDTDQLIEIPIVYENRVQDLHTVVLEKLHSSGAWWWRGWRFGTLASVASLDIHKMTISPHSVVLFNEMLQNVYNKLTEEQLTALRLELEAEQKSVSPAALEAQERKGLGL